MLEGHPASGLPLSLLGTPWCVKALLGVVDRVMEPPSATTTVAMELSVNTARTKVDSIKSQQSPTKPTGEPAF